MRFTLDEDGEICIAVRLYVETNMTRKDYGGKLLNLLFKINQICEKEFKDMHAFLEFKAYRV